VFSLSARTSSRICLLLLLSLLLLPRVVVGQDQSPAVADRPPVAADEGLGQWTPMGRLPVDQAGAGLRGYVMSGEGTDVAEPGGSQISVHAVAANNFYREQTGTFSISERYETHTLALSYRRGFRMSGVPRVEFGGQLQLIESDGGFLNGFISDGENFLAWATGQPSARNEFRRSATTQPALGTSLIDGGGLLYQARGTGAGLGDFSFVAKALLRDGVPASGRTRVAARVGVNVAGKSEFTSGNFAGVGVSVDRKVLGWMALHGDVRSTFLMDRESQWHLPLRRTTLAFSVAPEFRMTRRNSASIQFDGSTTPYRPTGTTAFDRGYGDITLGFSHRTQTARHQIVTQAYLRENMNLPFRVRWNTDPALSLGIKITIHSLR